VLQRVRKADVIHFKCAAHCLVELQFIFEQVDSIAQFRAFDGGVDIGNGRASTRRISNLGLKFLTFRFNPL
jgi:hypothetical protein